MEQNSCVRKMQHNNLICCMNKWITIPDTIANSFNQISSSIHLISSSQNDRMDTRYNVSFCYAELLKAIRKTWPTSSGTDNFSANRPTTGYYPTTPSVNLYALCNEWAYIKVVHTKFVFLWFAACTYNSDHTLFDLWHQPQACVHMQINIIIL